MKRFLPLLCLLILLGTMQIIQAQPNLVLSKPGKTHHFFYQVGDRIVYKDKTSGRKISGTILIMTDSTIELAHAPKINLNNISTVYRTRHFLAQTAGAGIVVLGIYVPISILNRAFQHESPLVNDDIYYVNGPMLAVSGISLIFVTRKFHIGEQWNLKVLDFGHPVYD
jgi:hypothetical protein